MKDFVKRFFSILSINTLLAIICAVGATLLSIYYGLKVDFPLTIIGIAVVFPIVFSIGGAYKRREAALVQYGIMKGMGRSMYLASRDWLRDTDSPEAQKNVKDFQNHFLQFFTLCVKLFQTENNGTFLKEEKAIYSEFSKMSQTIEKLRERGLNGSEVSRVNSHLSKLITAFEVIKHIYQYRTPRTLRLYSKFFIYVTLIILGPYFALLAEGQALWLGLIKPVLFAMVFTALDNIQDHLENPFDQVGEDDIQINPKKFVESLQV